jgi:superfamily II DNA/RNA helicase
VQITGDTPQEKRQREVDIFTNNPNYRVAILSLGVAREGLNLQVANHAVMTELDWTPGGLSQAEARIHRIGQTGSALITYLLYGSFEDILYKTLVSKVGTIDGVMGNEDAGGLDLVSALVEQVRGL